MQMYVTDARSKSAYIVQMRYKGAFYQINIFWKLLIFLLLLKLAMKRYLGNLNDSGL